MSFSVRWAQWQNSSVAKKWLPEGARRAGFTVVRVRPGARNLFVELAELVSLYGQLLGGRDKLPPHLDHAMTVWHLHTTQLLDALRAGVQDE